MLVLLFIIALTACEPNRAILESGPDNANAANAANSAGATPTPEPASQKVTVAELMQRVAAAPKDAFLFPCTLNAYSDADRESLKKLRQAWLGHEKDDHYNLSSAASCVCPGICLLKVEDTTKPPPSNSALIVIDHPDKYTWLARDLDLSHAEIGWASTTPYIHYLGDDGKRNGKACSVEKAASAFALRCPK